MTQLSPKGLRAVYEIAHRTGFSQDAVISMLISVMAGRGGMAQFSRSEFGGSQQWMAGGAIMISDILQCAQGAGARVVQRIVGADQERAGLHRRKLFSITKSGRVWGSSAWIIKRRGD
jgi:hypothetical protein